VFRLVPGQSVTIGRAPTNQIVLKDERCSRTHAEVFLEGGEWKLRDLQSRNGTAVGDESIHGDHSLRPGEIIRLGRSQLAFVDDLTQAFGRTTSSLPAGQIGEVSATDHATGDSQVLSEVPQQPDIVHRRGQARLLESRKLSDESVSRISRAGARLARLAFELAKGQEDVESLAERALSGVLESTHASCGAIWSLPGDFQEPPDTVPIELVASQTEDEQTYHPVSRFLVSTVLREREAVLARNVEGDSVVSNRDSKGLISATSVICAPIRIQDRVWGLIHLYSTSSGQPLDPDDLEFTLAVADTMAVALDNLTGREKLAKNLTHVRDENRQLRDRLGAHSEIVGKSDAIRAISDEIHRAASSKATVLIRGESGVGKELVARAVHRSSDRRDLPFICVNCAALTESLLESELFGHERGAFTGATDRKIGKFEAADTGTLFLDEIGEMSPLVQAKLLRVLEGHVYERVGGSEPVNVDVRVIAATNRDLETEVREKGFRRDLYFRLNVLPINVPPLRKRIEDVPILARSFLESIGAETGRKIRGFTPRAMDQLMKYRWPGNVRELRNVVERAMLLTQDDVIDENHLMLSNLPTAGDTGDVGEYTQQRYVPSSLSDMERRHIHATLKSTGWNKSRAATILGIERSTLDRKIRRYGLDVHRPAPGDKKLDAG
jgi:Nif-specific regulatory protein